MDCYSQAKIGSVRVRDHLNHCIMQSQLYPLNQRGDVTQVEIVVIVLRL